MLNYVKSYYFPLIRGMVTREKTKAPHNKKTKTNPFTLKGVLLFKLISQLIKNNK
jgi:hypothetical protein